MYPKVTRSWLKHLDFIFWDLLVLQVSYALAYFARNGFNNLYKNELYLTGAVLIGLLDCCAALFLGSYSGILRRGKFREARAVFQQTALVVAGLLLWLFLTKNSDTFSRSTLIYFGLFSLVLLFAEHTFWKWHLLHRSTEVFRRRAMLVAVEAKEAEHLLETIREHSYGGIDVIGAVLLDEEGHTGEHICGTEIVTEAEEAVTYIRKRWVDEVFIYSPNNHPMAAELADRCMEMGITTHQKLFLADAEHNYSVGHVAGNLVVTESLRIASFRQVFIKRMLDIAGGIAGVALTAVLTVFLAPAIYLASPGPVFFSQTRVGENGRLFKIYKFRSMYMDAEERKKDLMAQNQMKGFMFKMDADPRIIGSGKDGTKHGLGWFIRKTSLDEFPQFLNVLKGDMSLVGTRPPTMDEWQQYELRHRARLAMKPGLTGLWQVSGRSDITDFEDVVRMDLQYIRNWSIPGDLKILIKTVWIVVRGSGAR